MMRGGEEDLGVGDMMVEKMMGNKIWLKREVLGVNSQDKTRAQNVLDLVLGF